MECDPEIQKHAIVCATRKVASNSEIIDRLLSYHSSWYKLKKCSLDSCAYQAAVQQRQGNAFERYYREVDSR